MKTISTNRKAAVGMMLMGIFMAAWLAGCQTFGQGDMGRMVPEANRVAIPSPGKTVAGVFKTNDMTIEYHARRADDKLKLWGGGKIHFESIRELVFHLYFLDAQGRVIKIDNFYAFVDQDDFDVLKFNVPTFNRDFTIPPGAVAGAIGYDGTTIGSRPENQISFSHYPFGG
jgi:hypothetical protein